MLKVLLYGAVSGIVGTMLGGVISAFLSKKDKVIGVLFAVAAGVMLAIVSLRELFSWLFLTRLRKR